MANLDNVVSLKGILNYVRFWTNNEGKEWKMTGKLSVRRSYKSKDGSSIYDSIPIEIAGEKRMPAAHKMATDIGEKGIPIKISGEIRQDVYEKSGEKIYKICVLVNEYKRENYQAYVQIPQGQPPQGQPPQAYAQPQVYGQPPQAVATQPMAQPTPAYAQPPQAVATQPTAQPPQAYAQPVASQQMPQPPQAVTSQPMAQPTPAYAQSLASQPMPQAYAQPQTIVMENVNMPVVIENDGFVPISDEIEAALPFDD